MDTIPSILHATASRQPNAIALVHGPNRIEYAGLANRVDEIAAHLHRSGMPPLARVVVFQEKSIDFIITILAIMQAGYIAVPINPKLKPAQVEYIISDCEPELFVTTSFKATSLQSILPKEIPVLTTLDSFEKLSAEAKIFSIRRTSIDTDPAIIFYTSGSTGQPKGVVASHHNLVAGAKSVNHYLGTVAQDVIMAALPFSFDAGFSQITTALHAGACLVLHEYLRASELVKSCTVNNVTSITAIPPLWLQIADAQWPEDARNRLRIFANTGGHMPTNLLERLRLVFPNATPFLMYGLTEAFRSTYLDPDQIDARPNSIGKAIPNAEVLVLREDGSECDVNEPGELVHRGAHVCLGYWRDPVRTAEKFRSRQSFDGAFSQPEVWSGDIVRRDEEGFLYFISRRDEQIKTSGYRVSPNEVEQILLMHSSVAQSVVFGVPDPLLGERIIALVELTTDTEELEAHLRRSMPSYMIPEVVPVVDLPRNANGKLDRPSIKTAFLEKHSSDARYDPPYRD